MKQTAVARTLSWRGVVLALISALAYSTSFVLTANVLDDTTSPLTMTLFRFFSVVAVLGIWLTCRRELESPFSRVGLFSGAIGFFHFLGNFVMMVALTLAPASVTIVLFYTFPAVVLLLTCGLQRRWPTLVEIVTVVAAIVGVGLTVDPGSANVSADGALLALLGALCVAIMMLSTQRLSRYTKSLTITFNLALSATLFAATATLVTGHFELPSSIEGIRMLGWVMVLYPVALTCAVLAIGAAGAVTVALVLCIEPVLTVLLSVVFRNESLTLVQYAGVGLVVSAVVFMQILKATRRANTA